MSIKETKNQKSFFLSVAVSCKGWEPALKNNLRSLSRQDLDKKLWEPVFLFKEEQQNSSCVSLIQDYFPSPCFLFLPKGKALYEMRNLALRNLDSPYIYFIDEDIILENSDHLSRLVEIHKKNLEWTVVGAGYLDHPGCSFWGRSYNWISRLWMKSHRGFIPAGNLSVKTKKAFQARFYSPNPFGFGGEEVYFLKSLESEGHKVLRKKELSVQHLALHNFKAFVQRAWIQGSSLSFDKNRNKLNSSLFFKEKAPFLIKLVSLFYLLLVRFSSFFYKVSPS